MHTSDAGCQARSAGLVLGVLLLFAAHPMSSQINPSQHTPKGTMLYVPATKGATKAAQFLLISLLFTLMKNTDMRRNCAALVASLVAGT